MSGKPIVPGLIRRGNRFSLRVQIPKDLQTHYGRKEFWIKLGTEDRYEATSRALDILRDKRAEFELARRRLQGDYRIVSELSDHEVQSLGREIYAEYLARIDVITRGEEASSSEKWEEHVQGNEKVLAELESEYARQGDQHRIGRIHADKVLEDNLIRLRDGSNSYSALRRLATDAILELQRRHVARLRGREYPERPDPRFIGTTGEVHQFVRLRDQNVTPQKSTTLHSLIGRYVNSTHRVRSEKTKKSLLGYLETTASILGPGKDIRSITHSDCLEAREVIERLPPNFKKLRQFKGLPLKQIAEVAERNGLPRLSPQGVNNYVDGFYAFLRWCEGSELIDKVPARRELLRVADPESKDEKRLPFTDAQLQTIFSSDVYRTGNRSSAMFWVPLIALWNGMRSNEICQLDTADISQEDDTWCFDITGVSATGADDKSTKTKSSVRVLPIHPTLIEIGLIDFHSGRPTGGKLFGDLTRGADGYYSSVFSKRINRHLKTIGVHGPKHKFHSLRHNFRDEMRRAELDPGVARALGGWTNKNSEAFEIYGRGYSLTHLSRAVEKIEYPELKLAHLF